MDSLRTDARHERAERGEYEQAAGTRAFVAGDVDGVRTSIEAIRSMPGLATRDSMLLGSLEYLATKEGKTFREAELEMPE